MGSKTKELFARINSLEKKKFEEGPVISFYAECVSNTLWLIFSSTTKFLLMMSSTCTETWKVRLELPSV